MKVFTSEYGRLLILKVGLFFAMVCVAAVNRVRLTPLLPDVTATRNLGRNAFIENALGLIIILIVGALGILPPAGHMEMHDHMHQGEDMHPDLGLTNRVSDRADALGDRQHREVTFATRSGGLRSRSGARRNLEKRVSSSAR